jgi:ACS family hexuronate transporter-like MFS transporter
VASVLFSATLLSFFDRQVLSVLAPQITADLKMDNVAYSWVVFAFIFSYSLMFSIGGWFIDRIGTRRGLAFAVLVWSAASLLHGAARNVFHLGFCRFLLGMGEGGCFPGAAKGVLEWFPKRERALAMGFVTSGGSAIGAVVAPPLIVYVSIHTGWRAAFLFTGLMGAVWLLVWWLSYTTPRESRFLTDSEMQYIEQDREGKSEAAPGEPGPAASWSRLLQLRQVWGLVASRFLFDPVFYFYMFWIPQYLSQERGASLERIGQLAWVPFLTLGISSVIGGWMSDRLVLAGMTVNRARKIILAGSALLTPVSIVAVYVHSVEIAILLMSVLMFAHGFWITNYMTMIGDLFPSRMVATVVGMTGTAGGIGGFLTSLIIGRIVQSISFTPVFIAAGLIYPICAAVIFAAIREIKPMPLEQLTRRIPTMNA